MGTGQMVLTIMAIVLLGTTILSVNSSSLNQGTILRQTELGIYAVSLASSYIQRAAALDFDEKTVNGLLSITVPMPQPPNIPSTTLTAPASLGPEPGTPGTTVGVYETKNFDNTYDDFDDYNTFVKDTNISDVDKFHVHADVYYISQTAPFTKVTANTTWLKQMDIYVNNTVDRNVFEKNAVDKGTDTIKLSYILGFFK